MIDLKGKPFFLDEKGIRWVEETLASMSVKEKIGQLFCPIGLTEDREELKRKYLYFHIGGMMYRDVPRGEDMAQTHRFLQENSRIPLFLAANLECGGSGIAQDGTDYGCQMLVAASDNEKRAYELGSISAEEGSACGCNWAFAPVVDIDMNFRNPITNVRTYGSDAEKVRKMALACMKGIQEKGMAAAVKHFPGDGVDERDQHILTSVNSLSCEAWDETYGTVYRELIEEGVLSVMVGHIAQPAYEKQFDPKAEGIRPATLSPALLQGLLRGKLGFNGLISTDATQMLGFSCAMERKKAVPLAIESGCDVLLFNRSLEEDYEFMEQGYEKGLLSRKRLEEAVTRILAMKAALGLHEKKEKGMLVPDGVREVLGCREHKRKAGECADEGITLVKDTRHLLPIHPEQYPRLLLEVLTNGDREKLEDQYGDLFRKEGFRVEIYREESVKIFYEQRVEDFRNRYDLVVYIADMENESNHVTNRLQWYPLHGSNSQPWFTEEVPVLMVSTANPYHLLDAPMIHTYINTYCNTEHTRQALIEKLTGRSSFRGMSPSDPFCGREDTRY